MIFHADGGEKHIFAVVMTQVAFHPDSGHV
jgi:hypothetical protein